MQFLSKTLMIMALCFGLSILIAMPTVVEAKSPKNKNQSKNNSKNYPKKKNNKKKPALKSPASVASKIARASLVKDAAKRYASATAKYLVAKGMLRQVEIERDRMFRDQQSRDGSVNGEALKAMLRRVSDARSHVINAQRARNLYKNLIRLMTETKKVMSF